MKKVGWLILAISSFWSCTRISKQDAVFIEYVQTNDDVKTLFDVQILESNFKDTLTNGDSLNLLFLEYKNDHPTLEDNVDTFLKEQKVSYARNEKFITENRKRIDSFKVVLGNVSNEFIKIMTQFSISQINRHISDKMDIMIDLKNTIKSFSRYLDNRERIIGMVYEYKYLYNNPSNGGLKQKVTKSVLFDHQLDVVLAAW